MKYTVFLLPLACLLLLGAGCAADETDYDKNTAPPTVSSIPYYDINLDQGHVVGDTVTETVDMPDGMDDIEIEYQVTE